MKYYIFELSYKIIYRARFLAHRLVDNESGSYVFFVRSSNLYSLTHNQRLKDAHTNSYLSLSLCMDYLYSLSYKRIAGNFTFMSKKKEREIIQSDHSRINIEIRLNKIDYSLKNSYPAQAIN